MWKNAGFSCAVSPTAMDLQGQFHEPTHVNPIWCQRQLLDRLQYRYIFAGIILSQIHIPHLNLMWIRTSWVHCCNDHMQLVSQCLLVIFWSHNGHVSGHFCVAVINTIDSQNRICANLTSTVGLTTAHKMRPYHCTPAALTISITCVWVFWGANHKTL